MRNLLIPACLGCCYCFFAIASGDDLPVGVSNSQNPQDVSLTPADSLSRISVPDGFHVTLFAGEPDVRRPIAFDFDDRGRLWVVENYSHPHWKQDNATDRIVILEDTDGDGQFDQRKVFYDKGRYLTAIAVGHGGVWVGNTPELAFIPDRDRNDRPDGDPEVVLDGFQVSTNNVLNNFHWGHDGWLYGAIGLSSTSSVGPPAAADKDRVSITRGLWRFHPITHQFEKLAEGMVNPWGADFNEFGDLFTANTVLAHLWHIVPGMYCERRANEIDNPYAYSRIQSITNHLHWGGGQWQTSRNPTSQKEVKHQKSTSPNSSAATQVYHQHSVAGGGHAHCGAMIYLGDNWPDEYRGTFFTNNLHGNRINNDHLLPHRSTYVGTHADDVLLANDPWFRGMQIKYGPDGGVYVSDWHDIGECHDTDGSHRTSGRIYKVIYVEPDLEAFDLADRSDLDLAKLHTHRNEWFVRHARRILHERSLDGAIEASAVQFLWTRFEASPEVTEQLRTLWTLNLLQEVTSPRCVKLLQHENEHIRRWAVRFIADAARSGRMLSAAGQLQLVNLAIGENSARVRLELACCLPALPPSTRLSLATSLMSHQGDATDPYIPLMIWYGMEDMVPKHVPQSLRMAADAKIPLLRRYIYRRICDINQPPLELALRSVLQYRDLGKATDCLEGITDSLKEKGTQPTPELWPVVRNSFAGEESPDLNAAMLELAVCFGDRGVIAELRATVADESAHMQDRQLAFQSLQRLSDGLSLQMLHRLLNSADALRPLVLEALVTKCRDETGPILINGFSGYSDEEKTAAVSVLVTRQSSAENLLDAIESGVVRRDVVSPYALQQLRSFPSGKISSRVERLWADDRTSLEKGDELARLLSLMTVSHVRSGNAHAGRKVFHQTCTKCHRLFGEGGTIAPDLTGSGRKKPDYVLRNLIDPSEEIDAAYRLTTVITADGRLFSGFITKQDDSWLHLRTQDTTVKLSMNQIDELTTSNVSMMPDGMWKILNDQQIRDLLTYLSSDEQVQLPSP